MFLDLDREDRMRLGRVVVIMLKLTRIAMAIVLVVFGSQQLALHWELMEEQQEQQENAPPQIMAFWKSQQQQQLKTTTTMKTKKAVDDNDNYEKEIVFFYNTYFRNEKQNFINNTMGIMREQLNDLGSYLQELGLKKKKKKKKKKGEKKKNSLNTKLYYNSVGYDALTKGSREKKVFDTDLCHKNGLICHKIKHYDEAYEEVTLDDLYNYCKIDSNVNHTVVYFHAKGSFHTQKWRFDGRQKSWRRNMLRGVTSPQCIYDAFVDGVDDATTTNSNSNNNFKNCDVCGLIALPWPMPHLSGNFFTSKCRHIKQLLPPITFRNRMSEIVSEYWSRKKSGNFVNLHIEDRPWSLSENRMSSEMWITSLPGSKICDLSNTFDFDYWRTPNQDNLEVDNLDYFPRQNIKFKNGTRQHTVLTRYFPPQHDMQPILNKESYRKREYTLLPGLLFRWYMLYQKYPPSNSWVYDFFPDGQFWMNEIKRHNGNVLTAIDAVTSMYRKDYAPNINITRPGTGTGTGTS